MKTLDKQKLIDYLDAQANYFHDRNHIVMAGVFVMLRDEIEAGQFDSDSREDKEDGR